MREDVNDDWETENWDDKDWYGEEWDDANWNEDGWADWSPGITTQTDKIATVAAKAPQGGDYVSPCSY